MRTTHQVLESLKSKQNYSYILGLKFKLQFYGREFPKLAIVGCFSTSLISKMDVVLLKENVINQIEIFITEIMFKNHMIHEMLVKKCLE